MKCSHPDISAQWTPRLILCGKSGHFYIVDSYIYTNNKKWNVLLLLNGNNGYGNAQQCFAERSFDAEISF